MHRRRLAEALVLVLILALPAAQALAQERYDPYEQIYGPPVDVALEDLAQGTVPFEGQPVRTRGVVDVALPFGASLSSPARAYVLRKAGYSVRLLPRPETAGAWEFEASSHLGRRLEVTGFYHSSVDDGAVGLSGVLEFWRFVEAPDDRDLRRKAQASAVTLEALLARPDRWEGRLVSVAGEFRGRNLFGDLLSATQRGPRDWVLKDGPYACWVTNKLPRGDGFRLDPELRRDTGRWLEVAGRVEVVKGAVYLRASSIALTSRPVRDTPPPAPALPELPKRPPRVVFSLPLDGETNVAPQTRFVVQFSKDMDQASFAGRVALRYAGSAQVGDTGFDRLSVAYDEGLRALTVEPGDTLRAGRVVELILLPGIRDLEGLELSARPGRSVVGAAEILRFTAAP